MGIIVVLSLVLAGVIFYYFNRNYVFHSMDLWMKRYVKYFIISLFIVSILITILAQVAIFIIGIAGILMLFKILKDGSNKTRIITCSLLVIIVGGIFIKNINNNKNNTYSQIESQIELEDEINYDESQSYENKESVENEDYEVVDETESVVAEESTSEDSQQNLKDEYIQKLNSIEEEASTLSYDGSTVEMKETSSTVLKKWDDALNEIYGVLKTQLSSSEMESLKVEQREWIVTRDAGAKESASEFEGGSMYDLEYTESLSRQTKERCYELVEIYMK
ncbi:lysozyme inhibitor LprI family protein [Romboutsia sp.]|uniref:lysozyme inhibitor LprI family protein n=1 Tax=Romboutsia sp. TaxID=1965302 RepID=UPI003F3BB31F